MRTWGGKAIKEDIPSFQFSLGEHFSRVFKSLVAFRGIEAEKELLCLFGEHRLKELYTGTEPRFAELLTIADVLSFPLSTFQVHNSGSNSELEIAFAEVLYRAAHMNPAQISVLAETISALVSDNGILFGQAGTDVHAPPLRRNGNDRP